MDQFIKLYREYCKTNNVEENSLLIGEFHKVSGEENKTKGLNLSSFKIPENQCSILGKILMHDFIFTSIHLNDCNLSTEALKALLKGLLTNTTCKTLELKGNGIQGGGAEALAELLRRNSTLRHLRLEWNQLGSMYAASFSVFCDSLADNRSVVELDLRNNDINHVAASELVSALKRNKMLRSLDLRWNNVGLIGGQAFLTLFQTNSTLQDLQLVGNNIPDHIMESISMAMKKNAEQNQLNFDHSRNVAVLSRQLQNVEEEKDRQITSTLTRMSLQEQSMLKANRTLTEKLTNIQATLDERMMAFHTLSAKHALTEADLAAAKEQNKEAEKKMEKFELDKEQLIHRLHREFKLEKQDLIDIQEKLQRDLNDAEEIQRRSNEKNHDVERKCENLQSTIRELRDTIAMNDRNHQLKLTSMEEEIQRLKVKHQEELKDREMKANRDGQRLQDSHASTEQMLKDQLNKSENIRSSLEREINALKSSLSTQKLNHEELIQEERIRIKNDEEKKQQEVEDRLRIVLTSKDELESRLNQQIFNNRELQQKIHFQSVEIDALKRQIESIQLTITGKDNEVIEVREKSKIDFEKKLRTIQKEIETNDELKDRVRQLENELKDQRFTDRQSIRELESRVNELQTILNHRDQEIGRLRREEEQRLHFLRTAIVDYIGTATKNI